MKRTLLAPLFLALSLVLCEAASVTLAWDANPEPDIAGYRIYWRGTNQVYSTNFMVTVTNGLSGTVSGLTTRTWFVATAFNVSGLESDHSTEVTANASQPVPPRGLRIRSVLQVSTDLNQRDWLNLADLGERVVMVEPDPAKVFVRNRLTYELVELNLPLKTSEIIRPPIEK